MCKWLRGSGMVNVVSPETYSLPCRTILASSVCLPQRSHFTTALTWTRVFPLWGHFPRMFWNLHGPPTCQVRAQVPTTATVVVLMGPWRCWSWLWGAAVTWAERTGAWAGGARCGGKSQKWVQHILKSCGARTWFVSQLCLLCVLLHLMVLIWPCNKFFSSRGAISAAEKSDLEHTGFLLPCLQRRLWTLHNCHMRNIWVNRTFNWIYRCRNVNLKERRKKKL